MKDLYLKPYFKRREWLLENADKLDLSNEELLLCILFDYLDETNEAISYQVLSSKMHVDNNKLDEIIQKLVSKNILKISLSEEGISYDISKVFESLDNDIDVLKEDIFKSFEDAFNRPLSAFEMQKLSELTSTYGEEKLIEALRSADAYRKLNFAYIEMILKNNYESKN